MIVIEQTLDLSSAAIRQAIALELRVRGYQCSAGMVRLLALAEGIVARVVVQVVSPDPEGRDP